MERNVRVVVAGPLKSGKTSLVRSLFAPLHKSMFPTSGTYAMPNTMIPTAMVPGTQWEKLTMTADKDPVFLACPSELLKKTLGRDVEVWDMPTHDTAENRIPQAVREYCWGITKSADVLVYVCSTGMHGTITVHEDIQKLAAVEKQHRVFVHTKDDDWGNYKGLCKSEKARARALFRDEEMPFFSVPEDNLYARTPGLLESIQRAVVERRKEIAADDSYEIVTLSDTSISK